jgi:dihydroflavonol-4-reductase
LKILLTGASGFIGSAILRKLVERGDDVRTLVRPTSDKKNLLGLNSEVFYGDINDLYSIKSAIKNCQVLFHVAADYRLWALDPSEIIKTNVTGTHNIMTAAMDANIEKIIYTSSVATLGKNYNEAPANENTPSYLENMIGVYKRSKFLAEQKVQRMVVNRALPVIIVNPSAPVGPRDLKPTPTGRLIVKAANGEIPAFINTGLNIVHVDDVATGHLKALDKGIVGERYILGGENLTLEEILKLVSEFTGKTAPTINIPAKLVLPIAYLTQAWAKITKSSEPFITVDGVRMSQQKMYYDSSKAELELGYKSRPAKVAIRDAIEWFGEQGYLN